MEAESTEQQRLYVHHDGPHLGMPDVNYPVVYRIFNIHDDLLYVGCSVNLRSRIGDHRRNKPWWKEAFAVTITRYASRAEADAAESAAISAEQPWYNVHGITHPVLGLRQAWFPVRHSAARSQVEGPVIDPSDLMFRLTRLEQIADDPAEADPSLVLAALYVNTGLEFELRETSGAIAKRLDSHAAALAVQAIMTVSLTLTKFERKLAAKAALLGVISDEITNARGYLTKEQRQAHARALQDDPT